ncbi:MAG TPA: GspH/FimT family pseudopilin [Gemmatimonadaceae bacterium]|nr:GspH/FimT family pseudopilin [Gemmatimonadaceae bacterium]
MLENRRTVVRPRQGFNIIELLAALAFMSILLVIGAPKLLTLRDRGAVRSAKQQVSGYLAAARATAMREGTAASFHASGDTVWVSAENTAGGTAIVGSAIPLSSEFAVSLAAGANTVRFNSRGFATNLAANQVFRVTRAGFSDSICVSRLGTITSQCGF